jgi:CRP-like cAMP-binding protein
LTELEQYINSYFGIDKAEIKQISDLFEKHELKRGAFYTKTGKYCNRLSFIADGVIRIYANVDNKEVTQWIANQGFFVTDLGSLVFNNPSRFNIQALSDCTLYTINSENYKSIGKHIKNWHELEKLFIAKCFIMLENRVFSHLSLTAEERYSKLFAENPGLFNQVPLQYIASMLGITPETLSRIRAKTIS